MQTQDKLTPETSESNIGAKLRLRRKVKRLSLSVVASRSGISVGQLSQIERGLSAASLRSLRSICDALDMPMGWLFVSENGPEAGDTDMIVRAGYRRHLDLGLLGMTKELMTPDTCPNIQMMLIVIRPNGGSGSSLYNTAGAKCGTVLEGVLGLEVDGKYYELIKGDSFAFDSRLPYRINCVGKEECKVIWVTTPALY